MTPGAAAISSRETLEMWRRAVGALVRGDGPELTSRQLALLLTVYLTPPPHTVRGLAASLEISKPAVSRGLAAIERHGLVIRRRDETDRRNVLIHRTLKGAMRLNDLAEASLAPEARP